MNETVKALKRLRDAITWLQHEHRSDVPAHRLVTLDAETEAILHLARQDWTITTRSNRHDDVIGIRARRPSPRYRLIRSRPIPFDPDFPIRTD